MAIDWREDLIPEWTQTLLQYAENAGVEGWTVLVKSMASQLDMWWPLKSKEPWDRSIITELARNHDCSGMLASGWWQRRVDQIDYVTIHHTYGWNSPHALAEWYVQKDGGRPSIPYTIWVTETGEVLLCNKLTEGCWHDHSGHENTHLSIGMAGALHRYAPADVQLEAAARVCAWAINNPDMPLVKGVDEITGHMDWYSTACPGWLDTGEGAPSGLWKPRFYAKLDEALNA
ncbi:MAG: N-acetylmuramoyl-L-alanine amidase [Chloroflexi bacterium]|nr:N-acetylmuramoyl-L-alanine amidase [Chloroflexota bacterium]